VAPEVGVRGDYECRPTLEGTALPITHRCRFRSLRFHEKGQVVKGDGGALGAIAPTGVMVAEERRIGHIRRPCTSLPFALLVAEFSGRCMLRFVSVGRCKLTLELAWRRLSEAIAVTRTRCGSRWAVCIFDQFGGLRGVMRRERRAPLMSYYCGEAHRPRR
jgi:hypothetical protein